MQTKQCNTCHRELPLSDFHKDASSSDGHRYTCKACVSSYKKRMAIQRQENPEVSRYVPREGARMSSMQVVLCRQKTQMGSRAEGVWHNHAPGGPCSPQWCSLNAGASRAPIG